MRTYSPNLHGNDGLGVRVDGADAAAALDVAGHGVAAGGAGPAGRGGGRGASGLNGTKQRSRRPSADADGVVAHARGRSTEGSLAPGRRDVEAWKGRAQHAGAAAGCDWWSGGCGGWWWTGLWLRDLGRDLGRGGWVIAANRIAREEEVAGATRSRFGEFGVGKIAGIDEDEGGMGGEHARWNRTALIPTVRTR